MQDPDVTAAVRRFEALARQDLDPTESEPQLTQLVDQVRQEAGGRRERLRAVASGLEALAHTIETPTYRGPDRIDQGAPLRFAGLLRHAADLLRGPEKDLTPDALSGGAGATPAR